MKMKNRHTLMQWNCDIVSYNYVCPLPYYPNKIRRTFNEDALHSNDVTMPFCFPAYCRSTFCRWLKLRLKREKRKLNAKKKN